MTAVADGTLAPEEHGLATQHLEGCDRCRERLALFSRTALSPRSPPTPLLQEWAVPAPGELVGNKYRLERVIGAGGMGVVASAVHEQLNQRVALKFMKPALLQEPGATARFLREARAAVRLRSEHVGRVLDIGTLPSGGPFIVMELLEGEDLERTLARRGPLPIEEALRYVLQALDALAEAHAAGIVHRDLKPANLFVTKRPDGTACLKVLDFGVSKFSDTSDGMLQLTRPSMLLGSPTYMAPELLGASSPTDARTDIWALGCILFELLTGRPPFTATSLAELMLAVHSQQPPSLQGMRPEVSAGLEAAVCRCLAKRPDERYANLAELARALTPFAPSDQHSAAERIAAVLGVPLPLLHPEPPARARSGQGRGRRSYGWLAAVVSFSLALPGGWWLSSRLGLDERPRTPKASTAQAVPLEGPVPGEREALQAEAHSGEARGASERPKSVTPLTGPLSATTPPLPAKLQARAETPELPKGAPAAPSPAAPLRTAPKVPAPAPARAVDVFESRK